jgi:heme-degrading monooxygenase HmoA
MYCASFIFEPGEYDSEFHRLNGLIDGIARGMPGFLGADPWESADRTRRCINYYWSDLETLERFSEHPTHQEAKRQYGRWYRGYHIVIYRVLRSWGDGSISHVTPNERRAAAGE